MSTETDEELSELTTILNDAKLEHMIFKPHYENTAKKNKLINKSITKIIETINLIKIIRNNNITVLLGSPCLRNRLAHLITKVRYGSYIRSLHPDSKNPSSLSDKIYFKFKKFGILNRHLNPYHADACFISTPINSNFLQARSISSDRIKSIGAVWLEDNTRILLTNAPRRIFYLTQAYKEHNKPEAHLEQIEIIKRLLEISSEIKTDIIIRRHPRDNYDYVNEIGSQNIAINDDSPRDFMEQLNKQDTVISAFSTMAFEIAHLGGTIQFITLDSISAYEVAFRDVGIKPISWREIQQHHINSPTKIECNVFFEYQLMHLQEFCAES
ncbi:hypothetical protein [Pseudomonas sp. HY13-MNA-CIBAN-0226]|uniref:hypothetical protein n=1 Tax=Pseudomonas sp. HY13-MNA-CIBAN-0226 TaxID=3140473 RepID=UPI00331F0944